MKLATLAVTLAAGAIVSLPAQADEALAKKYMCLICHTLDKKLVGPSYHDVATKYKGERRPKANWSTRSRRAGWAPGGKSRCRRTTRCRMPM